MPEDYDSCAVSTCSRCEGSGTGCEANFGIMAARKAETLQKACCLVKITMITCRILMQDIPTVARVATIRRCSKRTKKKRVEKKL